MIPQPYRPALVVLLTAWLALSAWFFAANIQLEPTGRHAWAMSDYYAMALRFHENGLNVFHPQTYNLSTREGITAADLPVTSWLSAVVMTVAGAESPFVLRFVTWLAGLMGLFFLFRTLADAGVQPWRTVALTLFWGCLTGWVCYADSMLPSPVALSAFTAGLWAVRRSAISGESQLRYWIYAVAGLTLAALIRKPFVLYLAALVPMMWYFKVDRKRWAVLGIGLAVFISWELYDQYLASVYGSRFLRVLMYPDSIGEAWALTLEVIKKWGFWWCSPLHLVWLAVAGGVWLYDRKSLVGGARNNSVLFLLSAAGAGIVYAFAMLRQYGDHEYYALDSFYPALLTGAVALAAATKGRKWFVWVEWALLIGLLLWTKHALNVFWDISRFSVSEKTSRVYADSRPLLDSLHISPQAKMMVYEAYSDNQPLIGMRRPGYCLKDSKRTEQEKFLALQPDFAVCLDTFFVSDIVNDYPDVVSRLEYVGGNKDLLVLRPGHFQSGSLETLIGSGWTTFADTSMLSANAEYLLGSTQPATAGKKVVFYGRLAMDEPGELVATISLFKKGTGIRVVERGLRVRQGGQSVFCSTDIRVPNVDADEMKIYLWNPAHRMVSFDHFRVSVGTPKN